MSTYMHVVARLIAQLAGFVYGRDSSSPSGTVLTCGSTSGVSLFMRPRVAHGEDSGIVGDVRASAGRSRVAPPRTPVATRTHASKNGCTVLILDNGMATMRTIWC